jgi:predicted HAD superfamily Cof-like phosphohydrolase
LNPAVIEIIENFEFIEPTNYEKVLEFHRTYEAARKAQPELPDENLAALRLRLLQEEYAELFAEFGIEVKKEDLNTAKVQGNLADITKELCDILVVTYGFLVALGVDADKAFAEVHASNMSKLGEDGKPIYREDGKVLKGPNYRKADPVKLVNPIDKELL